MNISYIYSHLPPLKGEVAERSEAGGVKSASKINPQLLFYSVSAFKFCIPHS